MAKPLALGPVSEKKLSENSEYVNVNPEMRQTPLINCAEL